MTQHYLIQVQGAVPPSLSIINPTDAVFCRLLPSPLDGYCLQPSWQVCNHWEDWKRTNRMLLESTRRIFFSTSYVSLSLSFSFPHTVSSPSLYLLSAVFPAILNGSWIDKSYDYNSDPALKNTFTFICCSGDVCLQRPGEILRFHGVIL